MNRQAEVEIDSIFRNAHQMGVPKDAPIDQAHVRALMVAAYERGMAAEREATRRGTDEMNFGDTGGQTKA